MFTCYRPPLSPATALARTLLRGRCSPDTQEAIRRQAGHLNQGGQQRLAWHSIGPNPDGAQWFTWLEDARMALAPVDGAGNTVLHRLAQSHHRFLGEEPASVPRPFSSALAMAVLQRQPAWCTHRNAQGCTPLDIALMQNHVAAIQAFSGDDAGRLWHRALCEPLTTPATLAALLAELQPGSAGTQDPFLARHWPEPTGRPDRLFAKLSVLVEAGWIDPRHPALAGRLVHAWEEAWAWAQAEDRGGQPGRWFRTCDQIAALELAQHIDWVRAHAQRHVLNRLPPANPTDTRPRL